MRQFNFEKIVSRKNLTAILILALFGNLLIVGLSTQGIFSNMIAAVSPAAVIDLTNENRVHPVVENSALTLAAQSKAEDMAARGYFAHVDPEGREPWYWLDKVGYNYRSAGENLAINFDNSEDVVKAWIQSPEHYANIVKDSYTDIGIGVAEGTYKGKDAVFIVQYFGSTKKAGANTPIATSVNPEPQVLGATTLRNSEPSTVINPKNGARLFIVLFALAVIAGLLSLLKNKRKRKEAIGTAATIAAFLLILWFANDFIFSTTSLWSTAEFNEFIEVTR